MALTSMPSARMFRYEDAFTWATKPSAASNKDRIIRITNIGTNGSFFQSNGARWVPLNGSVIVSQSGTNVNLTGTVSETTMATATIPGGLIGSTGVLEILPTFNHPSSANNKTWRIKIGGISGTAYYDNTYTTTRSAMPMLAIRSTSTTAQKGASSAVAAGLGTSASAIITSAIDTTVDFTIVVTGQLASSGETMSLKGFSIVYRE